MKTFLLNIPQRLKLKSQELDVQTVLCNKAWSVFNDEGGKQLFIFQPDGTLYITTNGSVSNGTWKYIPANQSIIISSEGKSVMFHPTFLDDVIFALEMDGNSTCLFMIDENNQQSFSPQTLTELGLYFNAKEKYLVEKEKKQIEVARIEQEHIQKEEEKKQEEQRKREELWKKERESYNPQKERAKDFAVDSLLLGVPVFIGIVFIVFCLYLLFRSM